MNIRDIGGPGGPAPGPAGRGNPDRDSVERLQRALNKPEDKRERNNQEREDGPKGSEREAGPLSGAAILRGLQGPGAEAAGGLAGPGDIEGRLEALSEIADRLLVSEPGSADKEIRILIKESVLPGAEVRLTLKEGSVGVSFVCQNEQSALFLERHRADLERRLENRLGGPADVQVNRENSEGGDGRSRGQRDLYAEWSNQKD